MKYRDVNPLYREWTNNCNTDWWSNFTHAVASHKLAGFMLPHLIRKASNYTCKSCGEKVRDGYQIITEEPYRPVYHVLCYKKIYDKMMAEIMDFNNNNIFNGIPLDEKELLTAPTETQ